LVSARKQNAAKMIREKLFYIRGIQKIMSVHIETSMLQRGRIRRVMRLCCLSAMMVLSAFSLSAQDRFDGVRASIRKRIIDGATPSVAVAVAQHGRIIWEEGFGSANREERIPATENTMYSLASISKPITATGLMTLVQAGKIDLDKPINDYLGDAKLKARVGDASEATVRRVANHSSGLPLHYQFFFSNEPYRKPSYDETILRYGNLVTIPGEHYQYSNLGFGIIGYVLSRASEESYSDFMREAVFLKLGMTHTSVGIGPGLEQFQAIPLSMRAHMTWSALACSILRIIYPIKARFSPMPRSTRCISRRCPSPITPDMGSAGSPRTGPTVTMLCRTMEACLAFQPTWYSFPLRILLLWFS
jgi:CubicO group peptidase (beta-lactamase class C family)